MFDLRWHSIDTAPKDGTEILVSGGELYDNLGSPSFSGPYVVYWTMNEPDFPEGAWRIKAGFHTTKYGGFAVVYEPTVWFNPRWLDGPTAS